MTVLGAGGRAAPSGPLKPVASASIACGALGEYWVQLVINTLATQVKLGMDGMAQQHSACAGVDGQFTSRSV